MNVHHLARGRSRGLASSADLPAAYPHRQHTAGGPSASGGSAAAANTDPEYADRTAPWYSSGQLLGLNTCIVLHCIVSAADSSVDTGSDPARSLADSLQRELRADLGLAGLDSAGNTGSGAGGVDDMRLTIRLRTPAGRWRLGCRLTSDFPVLSAEWGGPRTCREHANLRV